MAAEDIAVAATVAATAAANHAPVTTKENLRQAEEEDTLHHVPLQEMEGVHHLLRVLLQETGDVHVKKIAASGN